MVPKGLKTGDTFEDGKRLYVVEAVNRDGTYYSRAVENGEAAPHQSAVRASDSFPQGGSQVTRKRRTKKQ
nr:MAG TPA: hypothetical protein [Bacteriophage sp.]